MVFLPGVDMHGSKGNDDGYTWPSHKKVEWVGPNKEKNRAEWERVNSKPSAKLGGSSSTSASSGRDRGK